MPSPGELLAMNSMTSKHIFIAATQSSEWKTTITPEKNAKQWGIGLETAKATLQASTQLAKRQAIHPLHRHFQTEVMQLRYPCLVGRHGCF
jgi:hypothetical protein